MPEMIDDLKRVIVLKGVAGGTAVGFPLQT